MILTCVVLECKSRFWKLKVYHLAFNTLLCGGALIAVRDELEEQIRLLAVDGRVPDIINPHEASIFKISAVLPIFGTCSLLFS